NVPEGEIGYKTLASSAFEGEFPRAHAPHRLNSALLKPGSNLLAVEVHLSSPAESSLSFDLALTGNFPAKPPTVSIFKPDNYSLIYDTRDDEWDQAIVIEGGQMTVCADASALDGAVTNV